MNKLTIFGLVLISLVGMTLAAVLGMFQATSDEPVAAATMSVDALTEDSYALLPEEEAVLDGLAVEEQNLMEAHREANATLGELEVSPKLQEIRDIYISFPQAFTDVVIQFQNGPHCDGAPACVVGDSEILVNKVWARSSTRAEQDLVLARQHAQIAIDRVWASATQASRDMEAIIPACTVAKDSQIVAEATGARAPLLAPAADLPLLALQDVIVSVMTGQKDDAAIFPLQFHSNQQIEIASEVATGHRPEIVVPVALPNCPE